MSSNDSTIKKLGIDFVDLNPLLVLEPKELVGDRHLKIEYKNLN